MAELADVPVREVKGKQLHACTHRCSSVGKQSSLFFEGELLHACTMHPCCCGLTHSSERSLLLLLLLQQSQILFLLLFQFNLLYDLWYLPLLHAVPL